VFLILRAILHAIFKHKKMHGIDYVISLQIVLRSVMALVLVLFPALVNAIAGKWVFGSYICTFLGFVKSIVKTIRKCLMVALSLDRFLLVFVPYKYQNTNARLF